MSVSYLCTTPYWSCQIYWWSWRYLHQHEGAVQLPLPHVRRKAGQVRCFRSSQRTQDAYVWEIEFSLGPPKCQSRRYHCPNHTQRRTLGGLLWSLIVRRDSAPRQILQTAVSSAWLLAQGSPCVLVKCLLPRCDFPTVPHLPHQHAGDKAYSLVQRRPIPTSWEEASQCHTELMQNCSSRNRIPEHLEPSLVPTALAQMSFLPPGGAGRELLGMGQLTTPWDDCTIPVANQKEEILFGCSVVFPSPPSPGN